MGAGGGAEPRSLPYRFYKLHERKCEPIIMTVPRKVRGRGEGLGGEGSEAEGNGAGPALCEH